MKSLQICLMRKNSDMSALDVWICLACVTSFVLGVIVAFVMSIIMSII